MKIRGSPHYLCWLMNQANIDAEGPDGYLRLCEVLHGTDFTPMIEMDENRTKDGICLRAEWAEYETNDENEQNLLICLTEMELGVESCTMMELLVTLARNMQYETLESQYEASMGKWFREMLCNCGLADFTNRIFDTDPEGTAGKAADILEVINRRKYGWDGEGGLFPLMYAQCDQRYVELVIQLNRYLEENYDIC